MRMMMVEDSVYELDDEGVWQGPQPLARAMTIVTEVALGQLGPADGMPLAYVFNTLAELLRATDVEDDTEYYKDVPPDVVF